MKKIIKSDYQTSTGLDMIIHKNFDYQANLKQT